MADLLALSSRVIDSGVVDEPVNRITNELSELADGLAIVESFSHSIVLDAGEGLVAFDASHARTGADVVAAIAALRAAIDSAVGGEAARVSFRGVNGMMASLLTAQDNADFAPTPSMRAAFSATCRELSTVHAAWQRVLQRDVPRANAVLARHNASPLPVRRAEAPPRC